jgi:glycosyltransferase involved in cell wall biosynthesis
MSPLEKRTVSAICITDHRLEYLRRSVTCFLQQSYPHKELVVVFPHHDLETRHYLESLASAEIRLIPVPSEDAISLGEKRNLAITMSTGYYFCTWDDDDWYHTDRIAHQVEQLIRTGQRSSAIANVLVFDTVENESYLSFLRPWEQTLLCEKSVFSSAVRYGNMNRGEDSVLISSLIQNDWLDVLFEPFLYVYIFHGGNTWHRQHWQQNIFRPGKKLDHDFSNILSEALAGNPEEGAKVIEAEWKKRCP